MIASEDEEFRNAFRTQRPDMVALDLGMPGMDGVELIRFLAAENFAAPVLIVSAFDRRVLETAFRLGEALGLTMVGPVEKPVRFEVLEGMLSRLKATSLAVTKRGDEVLLRALAHALEDQQLRMVYQPKVKLRDGRW